MNARLSTRRVAVLGAGIMGSATALEIARHGHEVVLVDEADVPLAGASRWNEGKIHLGYLYAADPTLATARSVLAGGVAFADLVSAQVGVDIRPAFALRDDHYIVHRDSVVGVHATRTRFRELTALVRDQPNAARYPGDAAHARLHELTRGEIAAMATPEHVIAGFRVPERSINTRWLADRYVDALRATPRIELAMQTRVAAVTPCGARFGLATTGNGTDLGDFDAVVNALWHGRLAVDRSLGLVPTPGWSHRYRVSLFVHTRRPIDTECAVVCTGPFGDIKNYDGRNFYLSWYAAGLRAEGGEIVPPPVPPLDAKGRERVIREVRTGLGALVPATHAVLDAADVIEVQGGWVFAQGKGSLADPRATVHRRDQFGFVRQGGYISVDTGKYSVAPALAVDLVARLDLGRGRA